MIEIKVDASSAIARFSDSGIPEGVRNNLRRTIPGLIRSLAEKVNQKLDTELKSRTHVQIIPPQGEMVETPTEVTGRVRVGWTGDSAASMVPQILETGARPHVIEAKNAGALSFIWGGQRVFFKKVNHPGFPGIHYMQRSFDEMRNEIFTGLRQAVDDGVQMK